MRNPFRAFLPLAGAGVLLIGLSGFPADAQDAAASVSTTRDTLERWVETQQLMAIEKAQWQQGKELLEQRISLLEGEIASLEQKLGEARAGLADVDDRRRDLRSDEQELEQASRVLAEAIGALESRTGTLVAGLPDPIADRVQPLADRLPQDPATSRLTLSERFQNVVGILNEVNKFNSDVVVVSELRELPDGTTVEVRALYLGLGQAWFVTTDGRAAGVGRPGFGGWVWTAADEMAPQIAQAIDIVEDQAVPAYVSLPVEIR